LLLPQPMPITARQSQPLNLIPRPGSTRPPVAHAMSFGRPKRLKKRFAPPVPSFESGRSTCRFGTWIPFSFFHVALSLKWPPRRFVIDCLFDKHGCPDVHPWTITFGVAPWNTTVALSTCAVLGLAFSLGLLGLSFRSKTTSTAISFLTELFQKAEALCTCAFLFTFYFHSGASLTLTYRLMSLQLPFIAQAQTQMKDNH
jgi:hypothetical protein